MLPLFPSKISPMAGNDLYFRILQEKPMSGKLIAAKRFLCVAVLLCVAMTAFSQASALRDYIGVIGGAYHPDALVFFDKIKENLRKNGRSDVAQAFDDYIRMGFGTGFVYVAPDGANYIITNYHVVAQTATISISFEKPDGSKTTYSRLRALAADEDIDLAVLAFADDARPFAAGLELVTDPAEEGADVFAAGFPGLGNEQIWQFSKGIISNARMRLPRKPVEDADVNEARFGPFIQHTAPIDPGNSGGPLLSARPDVPAGYAVVGVNSLKARGRTAAFYAIPAGRVLAYISEAINPRDEAAMRQGLDARLNRFVRGLARPQAVYDMIAEYLSNGCAASNAEFALMETFSRAPRAVRERIYNVSDPVAAIQYCVAWLVEDSFRGKTAGALRATLGDIARNTDGSYTVALRFSGDRVVSTTWVAEYGIWKLDKAGDLVSGDKTVLERSIRDRKAAKNLRTDYSWSASAAYAYFGVGGGDPRGSALDVSASMAISFVTYGLHLAFQGNDYGILEGTIGFAGAIRLGTIAFLPYGTAGTGISWHEENKDSYSYGESGAAMTIGFSVQGGLMFTTSSIPGLFLKTAYQFNLYDGLLGNQGSRKDSAHGLIIGAGYLFD
jgi:serine protease Do